MHRQKRTDTSHQPRMPMPAKSASSATNCKPHHVSLYSGQMSRPSVMAMPVSKECSAFQKKRSTTLVLKWYQNFWKRVPSMESPDALGRPNFIAGLPKRLPAEPGIFGTHVRKPTKVPGKTPSETWFSLPKKLLLPMTVREEIRMRPWSTSMLVSVLPLAKKTFSPISTVSGSIVCSDMLLPLPIFAPQRLRYQAWMEASPRLLEALVTMPIFMAAMSARGWKSGKSMPTGAVGSTLHAITGARRLQISLRMVKSGMTTMNTHKLFMKIGGKSSDSISCSACGFHPVPSKYWMACRESQMPRNATPYPKGARRKGKKAKRAPIQTILVCASPWQPPELEHRPLLSLLLPPLEIPFSRSSPSTASPSDLGPVRSTGIAPIRRPGTPVQRPSTTAPGGITVNGSTNAPSLISAPGATQD
mmetsp:Transcript_66165/g.171665  ORF Transcript_66165/g.171665 Transcript_66165/m.171665 type:complete len:417 (+) Transcript_66165:1199-2449(+)